jgi:branched-subunit amino acid transport protein
MKSYLLLIIGMTAVTYIPRLLPLIILTEKPLHPKVRQFLLYVPYTALSALIARGIMESDPGLTIVSAAGILAAGICSWFKGGLVLSVLASIAVSFIFLRH